MRWIADFFYFLVGVAYTPIALYNAVVLGKNRSGWGERLGRVRTFDPSRQRIWIHAVSLGEVNATRTLVNMLKERLPDVEVVVSSTTDTGFVRAVELFGSDRVFRFPLDFSMAVSGVLRRVKPIMIVLMELEVWYNLIHLASRIGIPIVIANGRLTQRSAKRLALLGPIARSMFERFTWVGAQDETIAERFRRLGVNPDRVEVTSSLKWDTAIIASRVSGDQALAWEMGIKGDRPLWVCGSTGSGEEKLLIEAYRSICAYWNSMARSVQGHNEQEQSRRLPILTIVPRKPERFDEVANLIEAFGYECVRRSRSNQACVEGGAVNDTPQRVLGDRSILLGDTMGELRKFYALADVVFVGRSLVPLGGSDPMEVAALGKPIVAGLYMDNFRSPVEALNEAQAICTVNSAEQLPEIITEWLSDTTLREDMGARAQRVVKHNQGATAQTVDRIIDILSRSSKRVFEPARKAKEHITQASVETWE